jgi:Fic-DOC domain mobile mystery protein B
VGKKPTVEEGPDGATPLDESERDGLIPPTVSTRGELNEWEALNIQRAYRWLGRRRRIDVLDVEFQRELHRQMFGETWTWAGEFRTTTKTISPYAAWQVPELMANLVADSRAQYEASDASATSLDDIAVRFHHRLTRIHPWPNGNGRHARLATDLLLEQSGRPAFTWREELTASGEARAQYIEALEAADGGDLRLLRAFCRDA